MRAGRWPNPEADHKNQHGTDNRWKNLREATRQANMRNLSLARNNSSGHIGVYKDARNGRFVARIQISGRKLQLGTFARFEDAVAVRKAAQREHGFADGHGSIRRRVRRRVPLGGTAAHV
jgi:hypothetical protein